MGGAAGRALQVLTSGGRSWLLRATMGGKRRDVGLGGCWRAFASQWSVASR